MQCFNVVALGTLVIMFGTIGRLWGLKCRSDTDDGSDEDEFQGAVRTCLVNGDFKWDPQSDGETADFRYSQYGGAHRPGERKSDSRSRSTRSRQNTRNQRDHETNGRDVRVYGNPDNTRAGADISLSNIEPCTVHCIFRQMNMLNNEGMPDKSLMSMVMARNVRDQRVKWFFEDSVDECFELFVPDDRSEKCEFAKNMGLCLQEKGRRTCEDWDYRPDLEQENKNEKSGHNNHYKQHYDMQH